MSKNYYEILGISKSASSEEIKRAYRKLAHQYHPDKGQGNEEKFKQVNEAYQVLGNQEKRGQYDTYGQTFDQAQRGGQGFGGFSGNPFEGFAGGFGQGAADFDLGDIFSDIFGGRQERESRRNRGINLEMIMTIEFAEAVFGVEKTIRVEKQDTCATCKGTGAQVGSKLVACRKCHGSGHMVVARRTIFGNVQSRTTCDACEGTGKVPENVCKTCEGSGVLRQEKTIAVKIPAGIDNGQRIRVAGEGEAGYRGSQPGDLYLVMQVRPSKEFARDGYNLLKELPVSFTQAALGAKLLVKTLDGDIELKIPAGTQAGTVFKVKGKGVPHVNGKGRGDLLITARVLVPNKLSKKEKELLKSLADERGETVEIDQGFWDTIKDNFE